MEHRHLGHVLSILKALSLNQTQTHLLQILYFCCCNLKILLKILDIKLACCRSHALKYLCKLPKNNIVFVSLIASQYPKNDH